jgi:hypothetical protein
MEEETWKILTTTGKLEADSLLAIQEMYYKKMKPVVSDEELVDLRQRYQLKRKEQA